MVDMFKILVVDDEKEARASLEMVLSGAGYKVRTAASATEALDILKKEYHPLVITDIMMPGINGIDFLKKLKGSYPQTIEVIMLTGYGSIENAVQTIKMGAFEYFIKGRSMEELLLSIKKCKVVIDLKANNQQKNGTQDQQFLLSSKNPVMQQVWDLADHIADTGANVLITGETGVGKEIVARRIHLQSARAKKLFVPVNCQNYPDNLIESELFGYEKGAFTGANDKRIGKIEAGSGGTLFLDEIGEIGLPTQVMLLRVLESKQIERIGSNNLIDIDFRLISATNRDLYTAVKASSFREDLWYRINTIEIKIPPLRERREDIPDLIDYFISKYKNETSRHISGLSAETERFLHQHQYPGNIRELKNIIERMVFLSRDGVLRVTESGPDNAEPRAVGKGQEIMPYRTAKQQFEREYIEEVLKVCGYNISQTAERIGISRRQLFNKITEYKINTNK